jgi:hypothetical protein
MAKDPGSSFGVFLQGLRDRTTTAAAQPMSSRYTRASLPAGAEHSSFGAFLWTLRSVERDQTVVQGTKVAASASELGEANEQESQLRPQSSARNGQPGLASTLEPSSEAGRDVRP